MRRCWLVQISKRNVGIFDWIFGLTDARFGVRRGRVAFQRAGAADSNDAARHHDRIGAAESHFADAVQRLRGCGLLLRWEQPRARHRQLPHGAANHFHAALVSLCKPFFFLHAHITRRSSFHWTNLIWISTGGVRHPARAESSDCSLRGVSRPWKTGAEEARQTPRRQHRQRETLQKQRSHPQAHGKSQLFRLLIEVNWMSAMTNELLISWRKRRTWPAVITLPSTVNCLKNCPLSLIMDTASIIGASHHSYTPENSSSGEPLKNSWI